MEEVTLNNATEELQKEHLDGKTAIEKAKEELELNNSRDKETSKKDDTKKREKKSNPVKDEKTTKVAEQEEPDDDIDDDIDDDNDIEEENEDEEDNSDGDDKLPDEDAEDEFSVEKIAELIKEKEQLPEDLAKEEAKQIAKLIDKRGTDVVNWARSYYHANKEIHKRNDEIEYLRHYQNTKPKFDLNVDGFASFVKSGNYKDKSGKVITEEDIVNFAIKEEPELYEDLPDDKIFKLKSKELLNIIKTAHQDRVVKELEQAKRIKSEIIDNYSEELQPEFKDLFKAIVSNADNTILLKGEYSPDIALEAVKGHFYDKHKEEWELNAKEQYKKGYKDGLKKRKLQSGVTNNGVTSLKSSKSKVLNKFQRQEAERIYKMVGKAKAHELYYMSHVKRTK